MKDFFKKAWSVFTAYPDSLDDYVGVGRWLIYKKLLILLAVGGLMLAAVLVWLLARPEKPFALPIFYYNEEALRVFSGEAVLLDEDGRVAYKGQIQSGLCEGRGRQLNPIDGAIVYEGDFAGNAYSGQGRLYKDSGLLYEGGFLEGKYSGLGTLHGEGESRYSGQFAGGEYNGRGVLYSGERVVYEGSFLDGLYQGEGTLYSMDGAVVYTGGFAKGKYSGQGVLMAADGAAVYEGSFRDGLYDGAGKLYAQDGIRLTFKGDFLKGTPARSGSIHNMQGQLLYVGNVYDGQADYIGLLGLSMKELQGMVRELPVIYCTDRWAGFIYRELGFAVITQYDYSGETADGTSPEVDKTGLLAERMDNLIANTMLVEGGRFYEQIPTKQTAEVYKAELTGFELFIESRLAAIENPLVLDSLGSTNIRCGANLYEVNGLPETIEYSEKGVYKSMISYYYRQSDTGKGAVPQVILCQRAEYGG